MRNRGIQHDNYDKNNVVLFSHDDTQPPIGRGTNIDTGGVNCRIDVSFVPRDMLPFAGTIRDLVAGKWLRGLSMSWQPIKARQLPDHSGGLEFQEVDLLEVSVVPLPALANALLDARSHGVDVTPLRAWASRALDMRAYRGAPRPVLEAIHRATSGTVISLSPPCACRTPTNVKEAVGQRFPLMASLKRFARSTIHLSSTGRCLRRTCSTASAMYFNATVVTAWAPYCSASRTNTSPRVASMIASVVALSVGTLRRGFS